MFGPPGIAYVYLVYGMYDCLNVVVEPAGSAAAVLLRAVEPVEGDDAMRRARLEHALRRRRGVLSEPTETARIAGLPSSRLASGPGLLGAAFAIDRGHSGIDLCDPRSPIRLERGPKGRVPEVVATPRIGIGHAGLPWTARAWRFIDPASPALSDRASGD